MTENYISLKEMEQRRQGHKIVAAAIEAARLCPFGASATTPRTGEFGAHSTARRVMSVTKL